MGIKTFIKSRGAGQDGCETWQQCDGNPACKDFDVVELWAHDFRNKIATSQVELQQIEGMNDCSTGKTSRLSDLVLHLDFMATNIQNDKLLDGKTTKTTGALKANKLAVVPDFSSLYLSVLHSSLELSYDPKAATTQQTCKSRLAKLEEAAKKYSDTSPAGVCHACPPQVLHAGVCHSCTTKCRSCASAYKIHRDASSLGNKKFCPMIQQKGTDEFDRFSIQDFLMDNPIDSDRVTCSMFGFDDAIVDEYTKEIEVLKSSLGKEVLSKEASAACIPSAIRHLHSITIDIGKVVDKIRAPTAKGDEEVNGKKREAIVRMKLQQLPSAAELYLTSLKTSLELSWTAFSVFDTPARHDCQATLDKFAQQSELAVNDTQKLYDNGRYDEESRLEAFNASLRLAKSLKQHGFCDELVKRGKPDVPERMSVLNFAKVFVDKQDPNCKNWEECDGYSACLRPKADGLLKIAGKTINCSVPYDIRSCWRANPYSTGQHPVAWSAASGGCLDRHISDVRECGIVCSLSPDCYGFWFFSNTTIKSGVGGTKCCLRKCPQTSNIAMQKALAGGQYYFLNTITSHPKGIPTSFSWESAAPSQIPKPKCVDDATYGAQCQKWKSQGFCTKPAKGDHDLYPVIRESWCCDTCNTCDTCKCDTCKYTYSPTLLPTTGDDTYTLAPTHSPKQKQSGLSICPTTLVLAPTATYLDTASGTTQNCGDTDVHCTEFGWNADGGTQRSTQQLFMSTPCCLQPGSKTSAPALASAHVQGGSSYALWSKTKMCKNGRWYPNTYAKADGHGQSTPASQLTEEQSAIAVNFCVAALAQDVSCSKEYIGVAWNNGNCWCVNAGDNCAVTKDHYWQYKLTVGHLLGKLESEISALTARVRQLEKDQDPADHNSADHNSADQEDIEHSAVEGRVHKSTPLQSKRIMQALIDRHHAFLHNGHALVLLSESSSINASPHDQCAGVQKPVSDKLLGASAAPTPAPTPSRPPTHTPTPVPTHVPTPSDDGDVRSEPHLDGTASQVEENVPFVPEVWHKATAKWYPICVGHFVNNEEGAITICNKLGFSAGAIVLRPDPKRSKRLVEKGGLSEDDATNDAGYEPRWPERLGSTNAAQLPRNLLSHQLRHLWLRARGSHRRLYARHGADSRHPQLLPLAVGLPDRSHRVETRSRPDSW
jgi:hypothetical protein